MPRAGNWYLTKNELDLAKVALGAVIGFAGSVLQRLFTRRDAREERANRRHDAIEDRQVQALQVILAQQAEARKLLNDEPDATVIPPAMNVVSEEIDRQSVFITETGVRTRMEELAGFLWWADKIAAQLGDGTTAQGVAWTAANEIGYLAGCLVRGESRDEPAWYQAWLKADHAAQIAAVRAGERPQDRVSPTSAPPSNFTG